MNYFMHAEKLESISDYQQLTGRHAIKDTVLTLPIAVLILVVIAYRYVVLQ